MKFELARSAAAVGALFTFSFTPLAQAAQASIRSVDGWNAGTVILNGRFSGQPSQTKGPHLRDAHRNFLAIESQNSDATFTLSGKNFGSDPGRVRFLSSDGSRLSGVSITVTRWRDNQVVVTARGGYDFKAVRNGTIELSRATKPKRNPAEAVGIFPVTGFVGVIRTRGYGQCTWETAYQRLAAGLRPPSPNAYASNVAIDAGYVPARWDVLMYGTKHQAIIVSTPELVTERDGTRRYRMRIQERNPWWDEAVHSSTREFAVRGRVVTKAIGSDAGATYLATAVWR